MGFASAAETAKSKHLMTLSYIYNKMWIKIKQGERRMNKKKLIRKSIGLLLSIALVMTLMPASAVQAAGSDFIISGGVRDTDYTYDPSGVLTFIQDGTYTVSMATSGTTTTTDRIVVAAGITATINLNNVSIDVSGAGACAFDMAGAAVNLELTGDNTLISGGGNAGIHCPDGAELTISDGTADGTGSLTVNGSYDPATITGGAGIGGSNEDGGTIIINSGTISASGVLYNLVCVIPCVMFLFRISFNIFFVYIHKKIFLFLKHQ